MRKNALGRTGLQISEMALGAGVTGGILIDADETTRAAALQRAVGAGVNWIDTAALYGNGASESNIGQHLAALSPRPHVSTKVRIETDQLADIAGAIERSLEQSLKRLRLDRISLFQLHNQLGVAAGRRPTLTQQQVLGRGGVADTFDRLKQQGLFRASGITAVGDPQTCLDVILVVRKRFGGATTGENTLMRAKMSSVGIFVWFWGRMQSRDLPSPL